MDGECCYYYSQLYEVSPPFLRIELMSLISLDDDALVSSSVRSEKRSPSCVLEDFANTFARLCRTFEVVFRSNLLCYRLTLHGHLSATEAFENVSGHTSSGVTGRWLTFLNSSMVLGSLLKSFLHPTSIIGRPAQKCITSAIHYPIVSIALGKVV